MISYSSVLILGLIAVANSECDSSSCVPSCEVRARTEAGLVCGVKKLDDSGAQYASFRGVPYAEQPLGELRFMELQPVKSWTGTYNATAEGPVCPYHYIFYGPLMRPESVSEACIFANIHVPLASLPDLDQDIQQGQNRLPIVVYIHGGGWIDGSGDADFNGPERLVSKGVIVITFNYRLDVFGFLSLNTAKVPGNNGLRDMLTLLRWVRRNAPSFGGDPEEVTLAGNSAGAASAHLLSLSPAAEGLFKRLWLMSGTGIPSFYTTSPEYAKITATSFLAALGLHSTDYDEVHDQLVQMPVERIMKASADVLAKNGIITFIPVVESSFPNVTRILEDHPETLIAKGVGKNITTVVGFTSVECETHKPRLRAIDVVTRYTQNALIGLPIDDVFRLPMNVTMAMAEKVRKRYMGSDPVTLENYVKLCSETYFAYPALKLARMRAASDGAPLYLYKYAYDAEYSVFKKMFNLSYEGAGHSEDMTSIFKVNSVFLPPSARDVDMSDWMTDLFVNFVKYKSPVPGKNSMFWPPEKVGSLECQTINDPSYSYVPLSTHDQEMVHFFDTLAYV